VTTYRPTTDLAFWKILNGHFSATGHPIHLLTSLFGSKVGFSRSADRMDRLPLLPNKDSAARHLEQERPAVADKPARRLRNVCTVYVRAVGL